jgi:hypothetical protein
MHQAMTEILTGNAEVAGQSGMRVHWQIVPAEAEGVPLVTLQVIDDAPTYHHGGNGGVRRARVQIDCWAESYAEMIGLRRAVARALDGYSGTLAGQSLQRVTIEQERDMGTEEAGRVGRLHRGSVDINVVWHEETAE